MSLLLSWVYPLWQAYSFSMSAAYPSHKTPPHYHNTKSWPYSQYQPSSFTWPQSKLTGDAGGQEQELQREVSALLEKLEAQGRELAGLQHYQMQASKLTATLHSTTDALQKSQAELQQTASALESTQHQLAQACAAASLQPRLAC